MSKLLYVGVLLCKWKCKIWFGKHTNNALYTMLSKFDNWSKSNNSSEEKIDLLLKINGITSL